MHFAVANDNKICTRILLNAGANVEAVDLNALTPLELAVFKKSCGPIKLLVEQKANMDFIVGKDMVFVNDCVNAK